MGWAWLGIAVPARRASSSSCKSLSETRIGPCACRICRWGISTFVGLRTLLCRCCIQSMYPCSSPFAPTVNSISTSITRGTVYSQLCSVRTYGAYIAAWTDDDDPKTGPAKHQKGGARGSMGGSRRCLSVAKCFSPLLRKTHHAFSFLLPVSFSCLVCYLSWFAFSPFPFPLAPHDRAVRPMLLASDADAGNAPLLSNNTNKVVSSSFLPVGRLCSASFRNTHTNTRTLLCTRSGRRRQPHCAYACLC